MRARETWVDVLGIDQEYEEEIQETRLAMLPVGETYIELLNEEPKPGHGGSRIVFLNPSSTGNVLIELAEIPE